MLKLTVPYLQQLVGNPDAFAVQTTEGIYVPVREKLTAKVLRAHLDHEYTVGTYIVKGDQARTLVFDIDQDTHLETAGIAERLRKGLLSFGASPGAIGIEFSGKKGYHVWYVLANYVPASELRRLGEAVCALMDWHGEVFPKQDRATDLGNLVKLPGGVHRVSGKENYFVEGHTPSHPENPVGWARVRELLPPVVAGRSEREAQSDRYPCMECVQNEGALEGSRHMELLQLAVMLRRGGVTPENVRLIVERTNELGDPMDERELENILSSAPKTGPVCSSVPSERQCGDLCVSARGLRPWPGRVLQAGIGEALVVTLKERTEAGTAVFEHPDVKNLRGTLK